MMPQFIPTHSFSARWQNLAFQGCHSQLPTLVKALAIASSNAAEEESPAPIGTSPAATLSIRE